MVRTATLVLVVFIASVYVSSGEILSFKIPPRVKECFYEDINHKMSSINLEYEVIEGGDLDIGVSVIGPNKQKIMHRLANFDVRRGGQNDPEKVELSNIDHGMYQICFDNIMASRDYKVIVLVNNNYKTNNYHKNNDKNNDEKLLQKSEMDNLSQSALKLIEELERLESLQKYTQKRMHRHLWTQESTSTRTDYMTIIQIIIVIITVIGQTVYIKAWFKSKQMSFRV
mmetsp:Transcript_9153/g.8226  ORF Transcript_9153/g.8226 Transcript_9153/m.8226 type:complete len:227 (+) Transcript_9153:43-723(+)